MEDDDEDNWLKFSEIKCETSDSARKGIVVLANTPSGYVRA